MAEKKFYYEAMTKSGAVHSGTIAAEDRSFVFGQLVDRSLVPVLIREIPPAAGPQGENGSADD